MRAIIVEDHPVDGRSIAAVLSREGFVVDLVTMGEEALEISKLYEYDVMVLDLRLPGSIDGFELIFKLRSSKIKFPILILSGLSEIEQKVKGLGFGADDFLTKPFNNSELLARLQAIIRRSKGHSESVVKIGDLSINLDSRTVTCFGKPVHLTSKEYAILELLSLRCGNILTKEMFLNHLYGGMDEPELKIIDVFVCKLRKKLAKASGGIGYVETVWGRGYVLNKMDSFVKSDCEAIESENNHYSCNFQKEKENQSIVEGSENPSSR